MTHPDPADLGHLRSLLGESAGMWAGAGVTIEPGRWSAFSGARMPDYNIVLCHGEGGDARVADAPEELRALGSPGIVMVCGRALGEVQPLLDAGWICIGTQPFMVHAFAGLRDAPAEPGVRKLEPDEVGVARELVGRVFGLEPELAAVALPDATATTPGRSVWVAEDEAGAIVSAVGASWAQDTFSAWSMATDPAARGRGHGSRLVRAIMRDAARAGMVRGIAQASPSGEPVYRALGFVEVERFQMWSRKRWVMGRG